MKIIDINTAYGPYTGVKLEITAFDLSVRLNKSQIFKAVTLSSYGVYHSFRDGNARTLKQCEDIDILIPAATIDPRGYFGQIEIIEQIKESGFKLLRFFPEMQKWDPEHVVFEEILELNNKTLMPIMVTCFKNGIITKLYNVAKDVTRFPIILQGVGYENMSEAVCVLKKSPNFMIETSNITVPSSLEYLYSEIGDERILFGSDACEKSARVAKDFINLASIQDSVKEKIFFNNANRILGGKF